MLDRLMLFFILGVVLWIATCTENLALKNLLKKVSYSDILPSCGDY
jgi:hypothetical protein